MAINQYLCHVIRNEKVADSVFRLVLEDSAFADAVQPCQFLMIGLPGQSVPFLKKPFSIYDVNSSSVSILYKVIGSGTAALSRLMPDATVNVLAPLGRACPAPPSGKRIALVAGGIGIASLHMLAQKIPQGFDLFYGVRTGADVIDLAKWETLAQRVFLASDDGSVGDKLFVTESVHRHIQDYDLVYACGPRVMLQKISEICTEYPIEYRVIMEEYMACGFGVCMGCVIDTTTGHKRICTDGPILDGREILW